MDSKTTDSTSVHSNNAPTPVGLYPHARKANGFCFLSGVGPREKGTSAVPGLITNEQGEIVRYDFEMQCHAVFRNVRTILEDAGCQWEKIIDVTVYLTNMKHDFPVFNRLWAEYFKESPPCRTTVEVNCLPTPIAIELKVIAIV